MVWNLGCIDSDHHVASSRVWGLGGWGAFRVCLRGYRPAAAISSGKGDQAGLFATFIKSIGPDSAMVAQCWDVAQL